MEPKQERSTHQIVHETFHRIACPLDGGSLYHTLEAAIQQAYELGLQTARVPVAGAMPQQALMAPGEGIQENS